MPGLLFHARQRLPAFWRLLASWELSIVLMVAGAVFYVFLTIWSARSPAPVVRNIAGLFPFVFVYVALLANTVACFVVRWSAVVRDARAEPLGSGQAPRWKHEDAKQSTDSICARVRREGFRAVSSHKGMLFRRARWASVGSLAFHGSFLIVALGFLTSWATHGTTTVRLAVGETLDLGERQQLIGRSEPAWFPLSTAERAWTLERVTPEFWRDQLLFTHFEAALRDQRGGVHRRHINSMSWWGLWTFFRLSGFGYAPRYELKDREGRRIDGAVVKLRLFPPGENDYFRIQRYPHRVYLQVFPNVPDIERPAEVVDMRLEAPALVVGVTRGKLTVAQGALRLGESLQFEGLSLSFPELLYWADFEIVDDAGVPILLLGFVMMLAGLLLRLRGRRAEIAVSSTGDGAGVRVEAWGDVLPSAVALNDDEKGAA